MSLGSFHITLNPIISDPWTSLWSVVDSSTKNIVYRFKYIVGSQSVIWVREDSDDGQDGEQTAMLHHQLQLLISEMESQLAVDSSRPAVDETLALRDIIGMSSEPGFGQFARPKQRDMALVNLVSKALQLARSDPDFNRRWSATTPSTPA
ncbi:hypothetical protein BJ741DRAFT_639695 [Chytriomyces cf. hyalinus JEL632]|nr:hypothetical protein BJ741DRAFT_639695 [Chytriomyces cf. hyalinus JEL632]